VNASTWAKRRTAALLCLCAALASLPGCSQAYIVRGSRSDYLAQASSQGRDPNTLMLTGQSLRAEGRTQSQLKFRCIDWDSAKPSAAPGLQQVDANTKGSAKLAGGIVLLVVGAALMIFGYANDPPPGGAKKPEDIQTGYAAGSALLDGGVVTGAVGLGAVLAGGILTAAGAVDPCTEAPALPLAAGLTGTTW